MKSIRILLAAATAYTGNAFSQTAAEVSVLTPPPRNQAEKLVRPFHFERRVGVGREADQHSSAGVAGARRQSLPVGAGRNRVGARKQRGHRHPALRAVSGAGSIAARRRRRRIAGRRSAHQPRSGEREPGGCFRQCQRRGRRRWRQLRRRHCDPVGNAASQSRSGAVCLWKFPAQHDAVEQHGTQPDSVFVE